MTTPDEKEKAAIKYNLPRDTLKVPFESFHELLYGPWKEGTTVDDHVGAWYNAIDDLCAKWAVREAQRKIAKAKCHTTANANVERVTCLPDSVIDMVRNTKMSPSDVAALKRDVARLEDELEAARRDLARANKILARDTEDYRDLVMSYVEVEEGMK